MEYFIYSNDKNKKQENMTIIENLIVLKLKYDFV